MAAYSSNLSGGTAAWNIAGTWTSSGGPGIPGAGDTAVITGGDHVTIPDGYGATVGTSPGAAGAVLILGVGATLTIGGGTSGSLTVMGGLVLTGGSSNTALNLNTGSTLTIDGSGNVGQVYLVDVQYLSRVIGNGATITSNLSGGASPGGLTTTAGGGHLELTNCAVSNLGTASTDAIFANFNMNYGGGASDWKALLTGCTFTNCGQVHLAEANEVDGARIEITRCVWSSTLSTAGTTYAIFLNPSALSASGATCLVTGCRFDAQVGFFAVPYMSLTSNVFWGNYGYQSTTPWGTFDGNLVRVTGATDQQNNIVGNFTNNFLYYDDPTHVNGHLTPILNNVNASSLNVSGNVLYSNATNDQTRGFLTNDSAVTCAIAIKFNILLPNGSGLASSDFASILNNASNVELTFEHNTICIEGHYGFPVESVTVANPARFQSVRANLFWASTGDITAAGNVTLPAFLTNDQTTADVIPESVIGYNGRFKTFDRSNATIANQSHGFAIDFSSAFSPTGDVASNTAITFKSSDVNAQQASYNGLQAFDASVRSVSYASGSEATARTGFQNGTTGYTVAAFLGFIRDAFRPTLPALQNASYPTDAATSDAAGNPYTGIPDIGAMAVLGSYSLTYAGQAQGAISALGATEGPPAATLALAAASGAAASALSGTWSGAVPASLAYAARAQPATSALDGTGAVVLTLGVDPRQGTSRPL